MRNIYKIMIWNQTKECMDREQMRLLQGARLKKLVHRVYHHTPFYRDKMQQMGLTPDDIDTIDDIVKLPFTTKQDLRTITRTGCSPPPNRRSSGCTPRPGRPANPRWSVTRTAIFRSGRSRSHAA